jgi:type IV pilus assembly protein PilM
LEIGRYRDNMKLRLPSFKLPRLSLSLKRKGCVGMVLDEQGLRYAEVRQVSSEVQINRLGVIKLDSGLVQGGKIMDRDKVRQQLALGLGKDMVKGKKAVLSVPTSMVLIRKMSLPRMRSAEIRPLLEIELESTIHLPFSRPYFDYYKIGSEQKQRKEKEHEEIVEDEYLIVAAPGDVIYEYMALFKELDMDLIAIDIEPLAIYRLLQCQGLQPTEQHYMFVQLGMHTVNVSFFEGEIPEFVRNIPLDLPGSILKLEEEVPFFDLAHPLEERGMFEAFANNLVMELDRVLNFYQFNMKNGDIRVEKIYVTGDFPALGEVLPFLQERLNTLEITLLPLSYVHMTQIDEKEFQAYTIPIGLSLRG